ncbi:C-type lectin domain family 6 member A-like isoform X4 [Trematomus bernacchii]|uniref:C-type lectin domain family 6 member A-like isoform X4 n=1 Tax=Trematomus bernacchii TaxID=40690 RepID=UPI00146E2483|nr:C-type lectin domain family 6 member A-like isoform X4 [Trematomus bernacchii]
MEEIYDDVDNVKTLSSSSSTIQEGPRRLLRASVLGLGLLSVFLLAGLIGLAVHYSAVESNLTEHLQARDQLINQLKASLTEKTREVDRLQCLMEKTCPEGWKMFGCSCYNLSTEEAYWEQSRQNCTAGGAHLVTVDSEEEQEFISSMIKGDTWIGLSDREEEGTWTWVDGSPLNLTLWEETQPDNGAERTHCAYISPSAWWNDQSCEDHLPWICEKEA